MPGKESELTCMKLVVDGKVELDEMIDMNSHTDEEDPQGHIFIKAFERLDKLVDSDNVHSVTLSVVTLDGAGLPKLEEEDDGPEK